MFEGVTNDGLKLEVRHLTLTQKVKEREKYHKCLKTMYHKSFIGSWESWQKRISSKKNHDIGSYN